MRVFGAGGVVTPDTMWRYFLVVVCVSCAGAALHSAQAGARRLALTGTVVVVNQQSDSVTLIDLQRLEAYRHVQVVGGPHEAAASPDGRTVLVTNYNKAGAVPQRTLSLIALPGGDTIKTIDLGEYRAPHDVFRAAGRSRTCRRAVSAKASA